ncbi:LolA family protein [Candidatus Methylobacter oryzae]|uniref:Outer membrane lipoprotein carrier protein LolA n=1 Tax=Candidatus Methylobacter oryzae TaxID=2497749 RepID=A0ABY3C992_9GAMM|nr:outer membrane lipoprotein carrier protein LolA [Candidatus Methylobacter oryzae]TRW93219.1 outer membrane lipoprotein carrier protein LolA [Candidatus Methylobacter oryzae]
MILIKALFLSLLLCGQGFASEDLLAGIAARLVKTPITQGEFHQQKHLKVLHKPLISSGTFTYDQNKGVIWKTLTPVVSVLLVNESKLLTGQGEQAVPAAFGKVFKAMLGGDLAALTDGFNVTGSDQKTSWQLELTPKDDMLKKVIGTMLLSGDTELRKLEIREAGGNVTDIAFDNISHPAQLTDEQQADFERLSP